MKLWRFNVCYNSPTALQNSKNLHKSYNKSPEANERSRRGKILNLVAGVATYNNNCHRKQQQQQSHYYNGIFNIFVELKKKGNELYEFAHNAKFEMRSRRMQKQNLAAPQKTEQ